MDGVPPRPGPEDSRALGGAWARFQRHDFPGPSAQLAPFVRRYWIVEWDYDEPYHQLIVPYPHGHLIFRDGGAPQVHGVSSGHVVRVLEGRGRVFGVEFRPGGFRPFLRASVSGLTDRVLPAADVPGLPPWSRRVPDVASVERWLLAAGPEPDPAAELVAGVVDEVAADPTITRVDKPAARVGTGVRRLQRLFAEHVGVGPKWVIRRYRLHETTERMERGDAIVWADLAGELGYADQAHFSRDFAALFGEPPTRYARRY
jgi:AraC-like DNA-binding protein